MQFSNYNSLATKFIAKAFEFDWLPLPLLKWLPLQPSMHSLTIATQILELASTDNLECRLASISSNRNNILLTNQDYAIKGGVFISERTMQHLWNDWKYVMFAPNAKVGKGRMVTVILLITEYEAIRRLLMKVYGIRSGVLLKTIIK